MLIPAPVQLERYHAIKRANRAEHAQPWQSPSALIQSRFWRTVALLPQTAASGPLVSSDEAAPVSLVGVIIEEQRRASFGLVV
jgi:hypothetical protein